MDPIYDLFENASIDLRPIVSADGAFTIAGLKLRRWSPPNDDASAPKSYHVDLTLQDVDGVLLAKSTINLRRWLERNRISYLSEDGYACLFAERRTYILLPDAKRMSSRHQLATTADVPEPNFRATRIVSPACFKILDAVLRLPQSTQKELSGQRLAQQLSISQSALSKVLTMVGAKSIGDFRAAALRISKAAWLDAMDEPRAVRQLTPFFRVAREYRLPDRELTSREAAQWTRDVLEQHGDSVRPGPLELAKASGKLADKLATFWCEDQNTAAALKRAYKLVPADGRGEALCAIAVPAGGLSKEAITSMFPSAGDFGLPAWVQSLNVIRAAWDLGYADSRAREARKALLEVAFDAVR